MSAATRQMRKRRDSTRKGAAGVMHFVPELQYRGLLRRDYEGQTLRDHLGLSRAAPPVRARQAAGAE